MNVIKGKEINADAKNKAILGAKRLCNVFLVGDSISYHILQQTL